MNIAENNTEYRNEYYLFKESKENIDDICEIEGERNKKLAYRNKNLYVHKYYYMYNKLRYY